MLLKKIKNKLIKEICLFKYGRVTPIYIPIIQGEFVKGKTILVTGGTAGIGLQIAKVCINNGANVIITGRNQTKIKQVCEELKQIASLNQVQILGFEIDVIDADALQEKMTNIFDEIGDITIDVLVNNAGIISSITAKNRIENFDDVMNTNLRGMYILSEIFSEYMIANKIKGNILNVLSSSSLRPAISPYTMSKWAGLGLTQGLAKKLIKYDIVVNAIAPGPTATSLLGVCDKNLIHTASPAGRYTTTVEIANLALLLISDAGRMVVGDTLFVTGGCGNLTVDDIKY